ncbi:DNA-directed RNA polymerase subunit omega, partial [Enterobacter mori]
PETALLNKYNSKKPVGKALEEIADGEIYPDGTIKLS